MTENTSIYFGLDHFLENMRASEQYLRQVCLIESKLLFASSLPELYQILTHEIRPLLGLDYFGMVLFDPDGLLDLTIADLLYKNKGKLYNEYGEVGMIQDYQIIRQLQRKSHQLRFTDYILEQHRLFVPESYGLSRIAMIPLAHNESIYGLLCLGSREYSTELRVSQDSLKRLTSIVAINLEVFIYRHYAVNTKLHNPVLSPMSLALFEEQLIREVSDAQRYGYPLACVLIRPDISRLDIEYGNSTSNRVLLRLEHLINQNLRNSDTLCYLEEGYFLIILTRVNQAGLKTVIKRLEQFIQSRPLLLTKTVMIDATLEITGSYCDTEHVIGEPAHLARQLLIENTVFAQDKLQCA